jgi:hypothetical protein
MGIFLLENKNFQRLVPVICAMLCIGDGKENLQTKTKKSNRHRPVVQGGSGFPGFQARERIGPSRTKVLAILADTFFREKGSELHHESEI